MSVNFLNICQGPADLYVALAGTAEPLDSAATIAGGPPGGGWVGVGGTEGGITFEQDDNYDDMTVTQLPLAIGSRRTAQSITVRTQMKEATLLNLSTALNSLVVTTASSGYTTVDPTGLQVVTQPIYSALIFDAWAPQLANGTQARRRVIVRKVAAKPKLTLFAEKEKAQMYDVVWQAYFVSPSVRPWHWIDQTA